MEGNFCTYAVLKITLLELLNGCINFTSPWIDRYLLDDYLFSLMINMFFSSCTLMIQNPFCGFCYLQAIKHFDQIWLCKRGFWATVKIWMMSCFFHKKFKRNINFIFFYFYLETLFLTEVVFMHFISLSLTTCRFLQLE